jgi:hypothetical protein
MRIMPEYTMQDALTGIATMSTSDLLSLDRRCGNGLDLAGKDNRPDVARKLLRLRRLVRMTLEGRRKVGAN